MRHTRLSIKDESLYINDRPTYEGRTWNGHSLEGMLFNTRMVQALFDDANPETQKHWAYPDTGKWDPQRNTDEFCKSLSLYRDHGVLGITIGLQGGGAIYTEEVYPAYRNSAFEPDGTRKEPYFKRLQQILETADRLGMVVIVSYFYVLGNSWLESPAAAKRAATETTIWLLNTRFENVVVEVFNEASPNSGPLFGADSIAGWLRLVRGIELDGHRLLVGNSPHPGGFKVPPPWMHEEDISLIHTNGKLPDEAVRYVCQWRQTEAFRRRPRPLVVNEDSTLCDNMTALLKERVSWGFYHQGFGSGYAHDIINWRLRNRESVFEELSGYQTVPVNWGINDMWKENYFSLVREITGGIGSNQSISR